MGLQREVEKMLTWKLLSIARMRARFTLSNILINISFFIFLKSHNNIIWCYTHVIIIWYLLLLAYYTDSSDIFRVETGYIYHFFYRTRNEGFKNASLAIQFVIWASH